MSLESPGSAKEIFLTAIEIPSDADREAFLKGACGEDQSLRDRVDALIGAHASPGNPLDRNPAEPDTDSQIGATIDVEHVDTQIGPYRLRERLGVGGMGVVWAAEQKEPLRRKVAVKVIKPGMDTDQVLARFAAEREALTRMDHPNIARVLDAGTTDQGRPYFVMELIRGVPITEYCDANKMTVRQRLALFTQTCKAVQHAHQKGVIHRDIKPSNVLVSEQDGEPIVKVIDFGVAKALFHSAGDTTAYSGVFQAIGTLAYMSPEQAGLSVSDVDTRADVYSLGVLLYELITGYTPFDKEKLKIAALDEAFRIIRENDPPKPSARASSLGSASRHVTQCRQTDVHGLYKSIRGDLDWIVMKCLDKNRKRRYDTPSALAEDILRYLHDEEVTAHAPTTAYRFRKLLQRNRALVFTLVLSFTLLAVTGGLGWVSYLNLRNAQIPVLIDSAAQREKVGDFAGAVETYYHLINLERGSARLADVVSHKASYARVLGKVNRFADAQEAFTTALSELANIADREDQQAIASTTQADLAACVNQILDRPSLESPDKAAALRLADAAHSLSAEYDLAAPHAVYSALARSQYENHQYRQAISTCLQCLSDKDLEENYLTYLILSAAYSHLGNTDRAYDWWLAADNCWFGVTISGRRDHVNLRRDAQALIELSDRALPGRLSVEEESLLYTRLLDQYPDAFPLRKYRAYCRIQLGRWQEARNDLDLLIERGWLTPYSMSPASLLGLFFEGNSFDVKRAEELRQRVFACAIHYDASTLAIAAMLVDRDGRLADQRLCDCFHVQESPVAYGLVLYRAKRFDEAYGLLLTSGDIFPARNALAEIIRALIEWERGDAEKARAGLARAEETIENLGLREGIARTNDDVGFATSAIWLEPLLLLREAREKIPRAPGALAKPIDHCLYPRRGS